jgi:hypothetical protein
MSERDGMQPEEEQEKEFLESSEQTEGERGLEEATHEPEAHVEATQEYQQAENIEASVIELIEEAGEPAPSDGAKDEISGLPVPIPKPASESVEAEAIEASVTEMIETSGVEPGENQISKIDSFTRETEDGLEQDVGATPLPIPNAPQVFDKEQDLGATPLPIPNEPNEVGTDAPPSVDPGGPYDQIAVESTTAGNEGQAEATPSDMPDSVPPVIRAEEIMLDRKGDDKPVGPESGEVIGIKLNSEAETPSEMPPELSEEEIIRKRPGKEEVDFKFFKPIPAEEDPIAEGGKVVGPHFTENEEDIPGGDQGESEGAAHYDSATGDEG